ncbi:hypothetical protein GUK30_10730 [Rhizobium leguminosarum]|nr:hypothetical protein [Rhizobium ruizarguesonis]NEH77349.1 hypothetical protein [Rhizobium ruizarguesonis]NEI19883.1 hypothetical protein [Rhizobium ruizarguesonis]NEI77195.1 hypothetical protein [Rhizobium ruizarguesonis]NEJ23444.1 hypothetical protein [Rhizobium leguminosarum]
MQDLRGVRLCRTPFALEHDAEKCERFSDDIMLYFFDLDADSDFRPIRPKIIRI